MKGNMKIFRISVRYKNAGPAKPRLREGLRLANNASAPKRPCDQSQDETHFDPGPSPPSPPLSLGCDYKLFLPVEFHYVNLS